MGEPQELIERFRAAFFAANGRATTTRLSYEPGWFIFQDGFFLPRRKRKSAFIGMIERMEARARGDTGERG